MPYTQLVKKYITVWFSHIIVAVFGISMILAPYLKKTSQVRFLNFNALMISGILLQPSIQKAPFVNKIIFFICALLALSSMIVVIDNPDNKNQS